MLALAYTKAVPIGVRGHFVKPQLRAADMEKVVDAELFEEEEEEQAGARE